MANTTRTVRQRVNITLPVDTMHLLDRHIERGERSRLIDEAVRFYLHEIGRKRLRQQLKAGAQAQGRRDRQLAREWFSVEHAYDA